MSNEEEIDKRVAGTEIAAMISKNAPDQRNGVLGSLGLIVDLVGKGRRRTVAVPYWVKQSVGQWTTAAGITKGPWLRPISKSGKLGEAALGDWSVWSVVESCAKEIGVKQFGPHDLRRTCAKLCRKSGGDLEQTSSARAFVDPNHRALSRFRAGDRRRRQ